MKASTPVGSVLSLGTRSIVIVFVVVFVANAVLLFVVLPMLGQVLSPRYNVGFQDLYDMIANNLVQSGGYRVEPGMSQTMMREPGYPLFLAVVFRLGGYHIETARVANLLLALGVAFMMMRLTRRVTDDELTAVIAALLFLFHPGTLISEARGGVEIAFIFVVLVFMLLLHRAVDKGNRSWYFAAGLALGAVVMVRSTPLLFPVFLFAYFVFTVSGAKERLRLLLNIAVLALGMVIVMSPWIVRNYTLVGQFVPTATVQGIAAQEGQYTCGLLSVDRDFVTLQREAGHQRDEFARQLGIPFEGTYYQVFYDARDEVTFNKALLQKVAMGYRDKPAFLARCAAKNLFNFWFLGKTWQTTWLNGLVQAPLLVLAFIGACGLWRRGKLREIGIMLTFVVGVVAVHAPIIAHARHSIPLVPFLAIPASIALVSIWRAYRIHERSEETCSS